MKNLLYHKYIHLLIYAFFSILMKKRILSLMIMTFFKGFIDFCISKIINKQVEKNYIEKCFLFIILINTKNKTLLKKYFFNMETLFLETLMRKS